MYKVIVNGAHGKMGSTTCQTIDGTTNYELLAGIDKSDDLEETLKAHQPDIVIDFTNAHSV